jgi:anti-sigma factor RsiW
MRSELFGDAAIALPPAQWVHPTVEEMAGYVDGTLASEEMQVVTDHLTRCERCVLAVDDLRAFSNQAAPALDREYYPATVPVSTQSRWPRLAAFLPPSFLKSPALAFGAVVLLLAGSGWVIWQALQKEDATQETVATTPSRTIPPPAPNTPDLSSTPPPVIAELHDGSAR